jgi:hypothetical protein
LHFHDSAHRVENLFSMRLFRAVAPSNELFLRDDATVFGATEIGPAGSGIQNVRESFSGTGAVTVGIAARRNSVLSHASLAVRGV